MYCIYTISVVLVLTVSQAYGNIVSSLHNLGLSPGTQIGPSSNFTQRWSSYDAPSYIVAVKPVTESDVAKVVRSSWASLYCVELTLTRTGSVCR